MVYRRKNPEKWITKTCEKCRGEYKVLQWRQNGSVRDHNGGWHTRRYCDACAPHNPYKVHSTRNH